ncbi:MAG: hypothetical protein ABIH37_03095 [archaeon]
MTLDEKAENLSLRATNSLVRGYNYITGGTKADLAEKFLGFGGLLTNVAPYCFNMLLLQPITLLNLYESYKKSKIFKDADYEEQRANYEESIGPFVKNNSRVEDFKGRLKLSIKGTLPLSLLVAITGNIGIDDEKMKLGAFFISSGMLLDVVSAQIMLADPVEPRDNIIKRYWNRRKSS